MKYLLVEAYWVHLSGTRIMRAGRDAWSVASFHYESQAARNSRYVAQVLMAEFFKKCVENKVRFIARDGNAVSTYEAPHPPAGAPSKPSIIEAVAMRTKARLLLIRLSTGQRKHVSVSWLGIQATRPWHRT